MASSPVRSGTWEVTTATIGVNVGAGRLSIHRVVKQGEFIEVPVISRIVATHRRKKIWHASRWTLTTWITQRRAAGVDEQTNGSGFEGNLLYLSYGKCTLFTVFVERVGWHRSKAAWCSPALSSTSGLDARARFSRRTPSPVSKAGRPLAKGLRAAACA